MKNSIKNTLTSNINVFQRSVPVFLILLVLMAGTGTAALLTVYGTAEGTANVQQSVTLNGEKSPEAGGSAVTYSYSVTGGELGQGDFTIQNNNHIAPVSVTTTVEDGPNPSGSSVSDGLTTSHVIYDQWKDDSSYDVDVTASKDHVLAGDYSLHFQSHSDGNDYARVFYSASVSGSDTVSYSGVAQGSSSLGDELWLVTSDGEQYFTPDAPNTTSNGDYTTVSWDLGSVTWENTTRHTVNPDFNDVVAIGIGQGAPATGGATVDTYIDDVQVSGTSLDEPQNPTMDILPTGDFGSVQTRYKANVVTDFAINTFPGEYTFETTVSPAGQ